MSRLRQLAKRTAARFGLHVRRSAAPNRFEAIDETLRRLRAAGYVPEVVIDGGANLGQFYRIVQPIFPTAHYHLIEPQAECAEVLDRLATGRSNIDIHHVAITVPGVNIVTMTGNGSTGAWVTNDHGNHGRAVPATSLDLLLRERIRPGGRALLKLDLESHELSALRGATALLKLVEAVLLEIAFYDFGNQGRPVFMDIMEFLRGEGFELFDVASLSGRPRDQRLRIGDLLFLRRDSSLYQDSLN